MTTKDKTALIVEGLTRICADVAALAAVLEDDVPQDAPVAEPAPAPEKVYTYEEILEVIAKYGLPQDWNDDGAKGPERYIEAHVWTDDPIRKYRDGTA